MNFPVLSPLAPYVVLGCLGLATFGGVQTWRIGNLKNDINVANGKVQGLTDANAKLQGKLDNVRDEAQASFNNLQATCSADVIASIRAGRLIQKVISAPAPSNGIRGRISADSVRQIFAGSDGQQPTGPVPH